MMKIKTSELEDYALDYAVTLAEGYAGISWYWDQAGPIIQRERITIRFWDNDKRVTAYMPQPGSTWYHDEKGEVLVAAMRCYVASRLGEEVDVPGVLLL